MEQRLTFRTSTQSSLPGLFGRLSSSVSTVNEKTKRVTVTLEAYASYSFFMNSSSGTYISIDGSKSYLTSTVYTTVNSYKVFLTATKDIEYYGDKTINISVYVGFTPNGIKYNSVSVNNYSNTYSVALPTNLLPDEYMPVISAFTVEDVDSVTTSLTGNNQRVIIGYSNIKATYSCYAQRGNTISRVELICGSKSSYKSSTSGNITLNDIEDNTLTLEVTDSAGYKRTSSITMSKVNYTELTNTSEAIKEASASESIIINFSGLCYNGSFGSQNNIINARYRFRDTTSQSFGNWISINNLEIDDNRYLHQLTINNMDYSKSYVFEIEVSDKLSSKTITCNVAKGLPAIAYDNEVIAMWGRFFLNDEELALNKFKFIEQGSVSANSTYSFNLYGNRLYLVVAYEFTTQLNSVNVSLAGNFSNNLLVPIVSGTNSPSITNSSGNLLIRETKGACAIYMIFKFNI